MSIGKIDHPVEHLAQDKLSVETQVKGFADFIMHCETPMAIAIQGAWGSGKTSFVNLVMGEIAESAPSTDAYAFIAFNVWQYSQFGLEDKLLTNLLNALTSEIRRGMPKNAEKGRKALETIGRAVRSIGKASLGVAGDLVKSKFDVDLKTHLSTAAEGFGDDEEFDAIGKLRKNFQVAVEERLGITDENRAETGDRRLVIFLDDLDRLSPDRAIEVLEILKIFLDCRYCVFLLAVDYEVVLNGVALKYKGTLSAQKGRDFFEKMIQVVYTMPSSLNHTTRYIASMLGENGLSRAMAADFTKLIKAAGKDNPRAIKRLVNSFVLLVRMKQQLEAYRDIEQDVVLFAVLCLQNTCTELYDYLVSCGDELPLDVLNRLKWVAFQPREHNRMSDQIRSELEQFDLLDESGKPNAAKREFLRVFFEQLVESVPGIELGVYDYHSDLDKEYAEILRDSLSMTCVTRLTNRTITEDDCVAFVLLDDFLVPCPGGTVSNAFEQSCEHLLKWMSDEQLEAAAKEFEFVKLGSGHGEVSFAIDLDMPVGEMPRQLELLARYIDDCGGYGTHIVWFSDKACRSELWSYRTAEATAASDAADALAIEEGFEDLFFE